MPNLAREIVFFSKLPDTLPAYTVSNNCITGIQTITNIYESIMNGRMEIGIAGGSEAMSDIPVFFSKKMSQIFMQFAKEKSIGGKLKLLLKIRPSDLKPQAPSIAEPSTGLTMGEHCELMAKEWKVSRQSKMKLPIKVKSARQQRKRNFETRIYPLMDLITINYSR
jgi:acetyl-CoA C-acetyltransferase